MTIAPRAALYGAILFCLAVSYSGTSSCREAEGGIVLSFDDRYVEEWYSLRELFIRYKARATFFITGFDRLDEEGVRMLKELQHDGHEIGSHGFRHVNATQFVKGRRVQDYLKEEILPSVEAMMMKGFTPTSFSYPYGAHNRAIDEIVAPYFKRIRGTAPSSRGKGLENMKDIYYKCDGQKILYGVGIDSSYGHSIGDIIKGLDYAKMQKEIILLHSHRPSGDGSPYTLPPSAIEEILRHASEIGLKFYTFSELR